MPCLTLFKSKKSYRNKRCKSLGEEIRNRPRDYSSAALPIYSFKICILGASSVGKTCLVKSFFGNGFSDKHTPTVDDYYVHSISLGRPNENHTVCIIDTSGTYTFPAMERLAIESSQGFLVVYALDDMESFKQAMSLLDLIVTIKGIDTEKISLNLIATKLDIESSKRQVTTEMALKEINRRTWINGEYIEVSSKAEFRVVYAFHSLVKNMIIESQSKEKKKARKLLARRIRSTKLIVRPRYKT